MVLAVGLAVLVFVTSCCSVSGPCNSTNSSASVCRDEDFMVGYEVAAFPFAPPKVEGSLSYGAVLLKDASASRFPAKAGHTYARGCYKIYFCSPDGSY